jgi:homoserine dehydrogenase
LGNIQGYWKLNIMKKNIGVGLMGLGVVGGQVVRVLTDKAKAGVLADYVGSPVVLRKIKIVDVDMERPLAKEMDSKLLTTDEEKFFNTSEIDIIVEAIGGEEPAFRYLKRALTAGKHVVTSNKEVVAKHGVELWSLAQQNNVGLHYEASAGGGIPLIAPFQRDLIANRIKSIHAIINGTTNYILTRMAKEDVNFNAALKKAQELGYAEANPRNDVDGVDATYKLAILASLAFHCQVRPEDIYCEGISRLTSRDFQYAKELGYAVKLLAIAKQEDNTIQVRVHPVFLPEDALLAGVDGVYNAIQVEGDLVGKLLFYGEGAGAFPTSSAVVADIASAAKDVLFKVGAGGGWKIESGKSIRPMAELETRYYLRMEVADQPGVLAKISQVLGDHLISIYSVLQKEANSTTGTAEIVIMTHPSREKAVQDALSKLKKLPVVKQISNFVRVEDVK